MLVPLDQKDLRVQLEVWAQLDRLETQVHQETLDRKACLVKQEVLVQPELQV